MKEFYASIKKQLIATVPELVNADADHAAIDWYLQQDKKPGEITDTPSAYIELFPIRWEKHGINIQRGGLKYRIHLMSETAYGNENDMLDDTHIDHLGIESKIYIALNGFSADLKFLDPTIEDTVNVQLMDSNTRQIQTVHKNQSKIIHTYQEFYCTVYDVNAIPACSEVIADLDLTVCFTVDINADLESA